MLAHSEGDNVFAARRPSRRQRIESSICRGEYRRAPQIEKMADLKSPEHPLEHLPAYLNLVVR